MADELVSVRTRSRSVTGRGVRMRLAVSVRRVVDRFVERRQARAVRVAGAVRGQVRQWRQLGGHQEHAEQHGRSRPSQFPECRLVAAHCLQDDSISDEARRRKDSRLPAMWSSWLRHHPVRNDAVRGYGARRARIMPGRRSAFGARARGSVRIIGACAAPDHIGGGSPEWPQGRPWPGVQSGVVEPGTWPGS